MRRVNGCLVPILMIALIPALVSAKAPVSTKLTHISDQIAKNPTNAKHYIERGITYRNLKAWDRAIADFYQAEQLAPKQHDYFYQRGITLLAAGNHQLAIEEFTRSIINNPTNNMASIFHRAKAYYETHQFALAARDYDLSISFMPATPDHYIKQATAHLHNPSTGQAYALLALERGMNRLGPDTSLEAHLLDLYTNAQNYKKALKLVNRIISNSGTENAWLLTRADLYHKSGLNEKALSDYHQILTRLEELSPRKRKLPVNRDLHKQVSQRLASL